jgi:hypothetical protein
MLSVRSLLHGPCPVVVHQQPESHFGIETPPRIVASHSLPEPLRAQTACLYCSMSSVRWMPPWIGDIESPREACTGRSVWGFELSEDTCVHRPLTRKEVRLDTKRLAKWHIMDDNWGEWVALRMKKVCCDSAKVVWLGSLSTSPPPSPSGEV